MTAPRARNPPQASTARTVFDSSKFSTTVLSYRQGDAIFTQGDACTSVLYIRSGGVKLSVSSRTRKDAIVAILGPGDFFGEGCLADQPRRVETATALCRSAAVRIGKARMRRLLHTQHTIADCFIGHMLTRNIRIEQELIDQLFNSNEKRLARALLVWARYGKRDRPARIVPSISEKTLARMVGTTRARVVFYLRKFKKLGFIEDGGAGLTIDRSLVSVLLQE